MEFYDDHMIFDARIFENDNFTTPICIAKRFITSLFPIPRPSNVTGDRVVNEQWFQLETCNSQLYVVRTHDYTFTELCNEIFGREIDTSYRSSEQAHNHQTTGTQTNTSQTSQKTTGEQDLEDSNISTPTHDSVSDDEYEAMKN